MLFDPILHYTRSKNVTEKSLKWGSQDNNLWMKEPKTIIWNRGELKTAIWQQGAKNWAEIFDLRVVQAQTPGV